MTYNIIISKVTNTWSAATWKAKVFLQRFQLLHKDNKDLASFTNKLELLGIHSKLFRGRNEKGNNKKQPS